MCSIFATISREDGAFAEQILEGLKTLEYRGYDSWGVAWLAATDRSKIQLEKRVGKIGNSLLHPSDPVKAAIGHTRWATHGGVTQANAHPHLDCTQTMALVHNGIVENYQELKAELSDHTWKSETDTEVIIHLLEQISQKLALKDAVRQVFQRLTGLNALVVLSASNQEILAIRRGSPLLLAENDSQTWLASDAVALVPYSNRVHYLKDDELVVLSASGLQLYSPEGKEISPVWETVPFTQTQVTQGDYPDYLMKEIHEQPAVLSAVLAQEKEISTFAAELTLPLILIGCGTAYNAGVFAAYIWSKLTGQMAQYVVGSELEHWQATLTHQHQPIFISQSGETIDLIESATYFKDQGIKVKAVVNRIGSTLHRLADSALILPAGPEICVLATKSFTAKVATFLLAAASVSGHLDTVKKDLTVAVRELPTLLADPFVKKHILPLAERLIKSPHIFIIGRGLSYPIALEGAMKIKEVTNLHVEGIPGGELKHGTMALIETGTPCIVIDPQDETRQAIISNAMEVKARGALVIGISPKANEAFDIHIPVSNVGLATAIGQTVVMQLLAYEMAKLLGKDVDKPRNLAKSVTVK